MNRTRTTGFLLPLAGILLSALATGSSLGQQADEAATRQYAAAVRLQNLESFDLAAEAWEGFLRDFPADARAAAATHYLGVCRHQLGKLAEAQKSFQQVLEKFPQSEFVEPATLYLGVTQFGLAKPENPKSYQQAEATFRKLAEKFPQGKYLPDALFYQGECAYMTGRKEQAEKFYAEVARKYPDHKLAADVLYALAVCRQELNHHEAAGQALDAFLQKFPQHELAAEVRFRRAEVSFALGNYADAASRFAQAAAVPGFALAERAMFRQAEALAQADQFRQSAEVYAALLAKFPQSKRASAAALAGGKCYYLAGDYEPARSLLAGVATGGGAEAPEAAHWAAQCWLKQSKPEEALKLVEGILPKAAKSEFQTVLMMDRADALYEIKGRRAESVAQYAQVAGEHPQSESAPQALYMAGFAALELGRYEEAGKYAQAFLAAHPKHALVPDVTHIAAESLLQLHHPQEAEQLFARLLADFPDHEDAELWQVRRALALSLQNRHAETIKALEPALAKLHNPDLLAEARFLLGASAVRVDRWEDAVGWLQASLAARPKWRRADETLLTLAYALAHLDRHKEAKATLEKLIAEFPSSGVLDQAHYRLGESCQALDDAEGAEKAYRQVIQQWPQSPMVPHALNELGSLQVNRSQQAEAEKTLSQLIERFPNHEVIVPARYARAMARQQLAKYAPAVDDFQAVLAANPKEPIRSDARYLLGLCQLGLKQAGPAAETFRTLLEQNPQYAGADNARYQWGWALLLSDRRAEAVTQFAKLVKDFPQSPLFAEAQHHIGEFFYDQKDYKKAAVAYYDAMKAAKQTPLGEKATHKLAWSYFHQDDFQGARQTFDFQLTTFPKGPLAGDAAFMVAECDFHLKKYADALAGYEKVAGLANDDFRVLVLLHAGQAADQLDRWDAGLDWLTKCVDQFPDSPYIAEALYEKGWAQQNLGKLDQAMETYAQVIAKSSAEPAARAQFMIGEIQFQKKQHSEAVKSFFKVAYGYGYANWQAEARYEAARCFEVLGKKTQAVKMYGELIEKHPQSDKVPLAKQRLAELQP